MAIRSYRDIKAYKRAKALIVPVHKLIEEFPVHERFDLCSQIRRASKSITANIVEGYSHGETPGKTKQFWRTAMGSADEMVEHLETAIALGYATREKCQPLIEEYTIVAKQLNKLIQIWRRF